MATTALRSAPAERNTFGSGDDLMSVGIDIGSTNTKIVLITCSSEPQEVAVRVFATPDSAEALSTATRDAVRELTASSSPHPVAVGIASMAESGVPVDVGGKPLSPMMRWNASAADTRVFEAVEGERFFSATGVPPLPKTPLAMWDRLRRHEPGLWQRLDRWYGVADLVAHDLTGAFATDHTLAGRSGAYLLPHDARLPRAFDPQMLALVGLEPHQLPGVVAPGDPVGHVTAGAARTTGLMVGTPVFIAGHDHAVGAWGIGARGPGDIADSMGTTEALVRILDAPVDRSAVFLTGMSVTRSVTGQHESLLAGGSGGSLVNGVDLAYDDASGIAPIGDLIVLPYPSGRQTPRPDPRADNRLIDRAGHTVDPSTRTAREIRRATLLGLCLHLRWMAETQQRAAESATVGGSGLWPDPLPVIGGAPAENAEWLALKAATLGTPLRVARASQPVACSAALLAAVRAGRCSPDVSLPTASVTPADTLTQRDVDAAYTAFRRAVLGTSRTAIPEERPA